MKRPDASTIAARTGGKVRLEPVDPDPAAHRAWLDYELASCVEGYLGPVMDVRTLVDTERVAWIERLGKEWGHGKERGPPEFGTRFWLVCEGDRVGSIALFDQRGSWALSLASLYVEPRARGAGVASEALLVARESAMLSGAQGIALDTHWTWDRPARLYLKLGFQVLHWKRTLRLFRAPTVPAPTFTTDGTRASYVLGEVPILSAEAVGDRLEWHDTPAAEGLREQRRDPTPTFALHLAHAGFPLLRSRESWDRSRHEFDVGGPEALARRILVWEALAREHGHLVRSPRIPGLRERTWSEINDPPHRAILEARLREQLASVPGLSVMTVPTRGGPSLHVSKDGAVRLGIGFSTHPGADAPDSMEVHLEVGVHSARVAVWVRSGARWTVSDPTETGLTAELPWGLRVDVGTLYGGLDLDPM